MEESQFKVVAITPLPTVSTTIYHHVMINTPHINNTLILTLPIKMMQLTAQMSESRRFPLPAGTIVDFRIESYTLAINVRSLQGNWLVRILEEELRDQNLNWSKRYARDLFGLDRLYTVKYNSIKAELVKYQLSEKNPENFKAILTSLR